MVLSIMSDVVLELKSVRGFDCHWRQKYKRRPSQNIVEADNNDERKIENAKSDTDKRELFGRYSK